MDNNYQKISTAYHEAGHVVYALHRLCKVEFVKLSPGSKDFAGMTKFYSYLHDVEDFDLKKYFFFTEIGINYAGMISEKTLYKKISGLNTFPLILKIGSHIDNKNSAIMIKRYNNLISNKKFFLKKEKMINSIFPVLDKYWKEIEAVAQFLLRNKRASYKSLKKIIKGTASNSDDWSQTFGYIDLLYKKKKILNESIIKNILKYRTKEL